MATNNLIPRGGKPQKSKMTIKDYFLLVCFIAAVVALFQNTALPAARELLGSTPSAQAGATAGHGKAQHGALKLKAMRARLPHARARVPHRLLRMRTHPLVRRTGYASWRLFQRHRSDN
jgi:hypothetical protein